MSCIHKDHETGWCKLHSSWSEPMPVIEYCVEGPCPDETPITNADRIRALTDDELAAIIASDFTSEVIPFCQNKAECDKMLETSTIPEEMCRKCALDWLRRPVEED